MSDTIETLELKLRSGPPEVTLAGSLTRPSKIATKGIVLLVSGSGPQDRNEAIAGKKPFLRLREVLAEAGYIAVSWDDRGVGQSGGDYLSANANVLVNDIRSAMTEIGRHDPTLPIILAGHSQGALIASMVAASSQRKQPAVRGLALLAGSGLPGRQMFNEQHQRICLSEGWGEASTKAMMDMKNACFDLMVDYQESLSESETRELQTKLRQIMQRFHTDWGYQADAVAEDIQFMVDDLMEWEWRFLLRSDPKTYLNQVRCPVFAAAGANDTQLSPEADLAAIQAALQPGQCTVRLIAGLNHLFQHSETGSISEYVTLGSPFHQDLTDPLIEWLGKIQS
ncbi:MAG: alpha/beta fold hydrolase [Pseudomonadota bacterium]